LERREGKYKRFEGISPSLSFKMEREMPDRAEGEARGGAGLKSAPAFSFF
jgi:hypothetical protein